jgi:hypothetical protein
LGARCAAWWTDSASSSTTTQKIPSRRPARCHPPIYSLGRRRARKFFPTTHPRLRHPITVDASDALCVVDCGGLSITSCGSRTILGACTTNRLVMDFEGVRLAYLGLSRLVLTYLLSQNTIHSNSRALFILPAEHPLRLLNSHVCSCVRPRKRKENQSARPRESIDLQAHT